MPVLWFLAAQLQSHLHTDEDVCPWPCGCRFKKRKLNGLSAYCFSQQLTYQYSVHRVSEMWSTLRDSCAHQVKKTLKWPQTALLLPLVVFRGRWFLSPGWVSCSRCLPAAAHRYPRGLPALLGLWITSAKSTSLIVSLCKRLQGCSCLLSDRTPREVLMSSTTALGYFNLGLCWMVAW